MKKFQELESLIIHNVDIIEDFYTSLGWGDTQTYHDDIWYDLADSFMMGPYTRFDKTQESEDLTLCQKLFNKFFDQYPELKGTINLIFTN